MRLFRDTSSSGRPVSRRARRMSEMLVSQSWSTGSQPSVMPAAAAQRAVTSATAVAASWAANGASASPNSRRLAKPGGVSRARSITRVRAASEPDRVDRGRRSASSCAARGTAMPVATTGPSTVTPPDGSKRMTWADGTPGSVRFSIWRTRADTIVAASIGRRRTPAAEMSARDGGMFGHVRRGTATSLPSRFPRAATDFQ